MQERGCVSDGKRVGGITTFIHITRYCRMNHQCLHHRSRRMKGPLRTEWIGRITQSCPEVRIVEILMYQRSITSRYRGRHRSTRFASDCTGLRVVDLSLGIGRKNGSTRSYDIGFNTTVWRRTSGRKIRDCSDVTNVIIRCRYCHRIF